MAWEGGSGGERVSGVRRRVLEVVRAQGWWEHGHGGENHVPPHAQTRTMAKTQSHAGADAFSRSAVAERPEASTLARMAARGMS